MPRIATKRRFRPSPPAAPTAPLPPAPPEAPLPPEAVERTVVVRELVDAGDGDNRRVIVIRRDKDGKHAAVDKDGKREVRREFRIVRPDGVHALDDKAFEKEMEELGIRMGKLGEEMGDLAVIDAEKLGKLHAKRFRVDRMAPLAELRVPVIEMKCDGDGPRQRNHQRATGSGSSASAAASVSGHAAMSLRAARDQIARQGGMNEDTRQEVLRSLDGEIERLEAAKDAPGKSVPSFPGRRRGRRCRPRSRVSAWRISCPAPAGSTGSDTKPASGSARAFLPFLTAGGGDRLRHPLRTRAGRGRRSPSAGRGP